VVVRVVERSFLFKILEHSRRSSLPKRSPSSKGSSKAAHWIWLRRMRRLSGVDEPMLRRPSEEVIWIFDDELVDGLAPGDQDRERPRGSPAGPARLLVGARNASRISYDQADVEISDVNPEFEAFVEMTARTSFSRNPFSISLRTRGR